MAEWTIWHNPRCSKSRQALELLRGRNVEVEVRNYLDSPPSHAEIARVLTALGVEPRELMRIGEPIYRELGLDAEDKTRAELIDAMAEHPILIERPVVFGDKSAVIARPPERIDELF